MKGSERHRLKENEVSQVVGRMAERARENSRTLTMAGVGVLVVLAAGAAYWAWQARTESRAQGLLAEAITIVQAPVQGAAGTPPAAGSYPSVQARAEAALAKLTDTYTAYPDSDAGIAARYYAAASLAMLGRPDEAVSRYEEVVDRAGADSFYGRMAQLGVVEASAQARQFDRAITAAQALLDNTTQEVIPTDALLMQLGRVQLAAGKKAEAKQTLDRVIAEFPDSPYLDEAREMLAETT